MASRRQVLLLVSLSMVTGVHLIIIWLLVSSPRLQLAAKNAVDNQLAQQRHELDFAHAFPMLPKKPQQFAWNYAATHRIEAIPGGGMLVHLGDNCVLILFPLPFVGCGIGKRPANGDLFEHRRDQ